MTSTLDLVRDCVDRGEVGVSEHASDELDNDSIDLDDVLAGVPHAVGIEDYPASWKGPSVLALRRSRDGQPLHVVRGLAKGTSGPAVPVTAYRPDPAKWSDDLLRRQ